MKDPHQVNDKAQNIMDNKVSKAIQDISEIIDDMISLNPDQKKQVLSAIEDLKTHPSE